MQEEMISSIRNKAKVMDALRQYRPTLIRMFQSVTEVSAEVQPQTKTPVVNFTSEVVRDLPPRMRLHLLRDFEEWVDSCGRDFLTTEVADIELACNSTMTANGVELVLFDADTTYNITENITYEMLSPFIQAGLDWHPRAATFFVPRS